MLWTSTLDQSNHSCPWWTENVPGRSKKRERICIEMIWQVAWYNYIPQWSYWSSLTSPVVPPSHYADCYFAGNLLIFLWIQYTHWACMYSKIINKLQWPFMVLRDAETNLCQAISLLHNHLISESDVFEISHVQAPSRWTNSYQFRYFRILHFSYVLKCSDKFEYFSWSFCRNVSSTVALDMIKYNQGI